MIIKQIILSDFNIIVQINDKVIATIDYIERYI